MRRGLERPGGRGGVLDEFRRSLDPAAYLRDVLGVHAWADRGDEMSFSCPLPFGLHKNGDQSASAALNRHKLLFNCFVCGGGDVLWLTQEVLGVGAREALNLLRGAGTAREPNREDFLAELEAMWKDGEGEALTIPEYSEVLLRNWKCYSAYMDARRVSRDVQREMRTGLDLAHRDEYAGQWFDVPRVVVPHFWRGRLVGWSKRVVSDDLPRGIPKYKHTPGFPKALTLYGADLAVPEEPLIVVESPLSVLRMRSEGVRNAVATFGAKVTDEQVALLRAYDRVILFFDGDYAGNAAVMDVAERLDKFTRVWAVELGDRDGYDPGDMERDELLDHIGRAYPAALAGIERR